MGAPLDLRGDGRWAPRVVIGLLVKLMTRDKQVRTKSAKQSEWPHLGRQVPIGHRVIATGKKLGNSLDPLLHLYQGIPQYLRI